MIDKRKFYINGTWVNPIKKNDFDVINPSNEKPYACISLGSKKDVDLAVTAAKNAFVTWSQVAKKEKINLLFANHEEQIANPLLEYINNNKDLKLIGKNIINKRNRAPTISFTSRSKTSKEISNHLVNNKIATRNDNFYAWRCLEALNIDTKDGVVRTSIVHYNTFNEVEKIIKVLKNL